MGASDGRDRRDHPLGSLSRRGFLIGAAGVSGTAAAEAAKKSATAQVVVPSVVSAAQQVAAFALNSKPTFTTLIRRREDFLFMRVDGYNLVRQAAASGKSKPRKAGPVTQNLVRHVAGRDAFLVFEHLPQSLAEEAFTGAAKGPGGSQARLAYPTRLAFKIPSKTHTIPLTLDGLLDWAAFEPSLVPAAAKGPTRAVAVSASAHAAKATSPGPTKKKPAPKPRPSVPKLRKPSSTETAIELPWRLALSPLTGGRWSHETGLRTLNGWTELWRTRLATSPDPLAADGAPIRAVWNYDTHNGKPTLDDRSHRPKDYGAAVAQGPFLAAMNVDHRYQIVRASSDFSVHGRADIAASRLWLSSRGGFLDSIGVWDLSGPFSLAEWKHDATLGRDQYVKIVLKGHLFPFGHAAVRVIVTERHFVKVGSEIVAAWLQHNYIVVRQPDRSYRAGAFGVGPNGSRDFPFVSLHMTTLRTPDLAAPTLLVPGAVGPKSKHTNAFVPHNVDNSLFEFHMIGTDWAGRQVPFTAPAVFVEQPDEFDSELAAAIRTKYAGLADGTNIGQFEGRTVAFAPYHKLGDTDLGVKTMTFGAAPGTQDGATNATFTDLDEPRTYPNLQQAAVRLAAAEQASGGAPLDKMPLVSYYQPYLDHGLDPATDPAANLGRVFMHVDAASAPTVNFGGGSAGGVITPNFAVSGLSRSLGPIAGTTPDNIAKGQFTASDIFKEVDAKILGGVKLFDLLADVLFPGGDSAPGDNALKITYSTQGTSQTTKLHWVPAVKDNPVIVMHGDGSFTIDGEITTDVANPANTTFSVNGALKGFDVFLMQKPDSALSFIAIHLNELTFSAVKGQKSHVKVDLIDVEFLGVLEFVEKLEDIIDFSGDGGPKIEVQPTGISADLAVPIPDISVGILALTNISIDLGFNLPFDGSPARFRFSFATRDNPFGLSVAIFGGAGFFGLAIGTDGVEKIEASLEFGAMCSIDLGVASGSVHLTAGIYFSYGDDGTGNLTCVLSGFVKLGGQLSILGIVSISLEFDMSLTYVSSPSSVTGTATLSVSISVLFFSFSASVTASKTFAGSGGGASMSLALSGGDPVPPPPVTFVQQVTAQNWNDYCDAFATN